MRDVLAVVEAVGCEHERIVAHDLDAHVAHAMSGCASHRDSLRDRIAVGHGFEPPCRVEHREQPRADVVGRVGVGGSRRRGGVLVHDDTGVRERQAELLRPGSVEQPARMVVVEVGEHDEIDVRRADADRRERTFGVRVDPVERPPRGR
jgi:hypothetical protein